MQAYAWFVRSRVLIAPGHHQRACHGRTLIRLPPFSLCCCFNVFLANCQIRLPFQDLVAAVRGWMSEHSARNIRYPVSSTAIPLKHSASPPRVGKAVGSQLAWRDSLLAPSFERCGPLAVLCACSQGVAFLLLGATMGQRLLAILQSKLCLLKVALLAATYCNSIHSWANLPTPMYWHKVLHQYLSANACNWETCQCISVVAVFFRDPPVTPEWGPVAAATRALF
jgi:hypothetical protein